jgi:hypothetical protein
MPDGGIIDLYEKGCSVRLYLRLFVVGLVSYLGYLSLFAYSGVQCSCFVCLRLVYPVLPVSFDCPVLITPSIFSNVYCTLIL